jgi:hypothetical protein
MWQAELRVQAWWVQKNSAFLFIGTMIVPFQVWHLAVEQLFYFENLTSAPKKQFWTFDKTLFKFKNI